MLHAGYRKDEYGIAIIRWALFDILYQRASSLGAAIETSRPVRSVESDARARIVFDNGAKSPKFDLVVDAMGVRSPLRRVKGRELTYGALWVNPPWQEGIGFERNWCLTPLYQSDCWILPVLRRLSHRPGPAPPWPYFRHGDGDGHPADA